MVLSILVFLWAQYFAYISFAIFQLENTNFKNILKMGHVEQKRICGAKMGRMEQKCEAWREMGPVEQSQTLRELLGS